MPNQRSNASGEVTTGGGDLSPAMVAGIAGHAAAGPRR
jgi:hypothetical protein